MSNEYLDAFREILRECTDEELELSVDDYERRIDRPAPRETADEHRERLGEERIAIYDELQRRAIIRGEINRLIDEIERLQGML